MIQQTIFKTKASADYHNFNRPGTVTYGIHFIPGNHDAYFTITGRWGGSRDAYGGASHNLIADLHPELKPWIALHLSDTEGVPLHAVENGWYWAGGTEWVTGDAQILAKHLRITKGQASKIIRDRDDGLFTKTDFEALVEGLKPRWKAEAGNLLAELGV